MENPFKNQVLKLKRTAKLTQIIAKYGFQELISNRYNDSGTDKDGLFQDPTIYERIRLAIEELGPTFVKFGQTLSTREDLFPDAFVTELKKLQDLVLPQELDVVSYIEEQLHIEFKDFFQSMDEKPFASASIAQVYKATLIDGTPVIIKVKRPNIRTTIHSDLMILRDVVHFLSAYSEKIRQINLKNILDAFQKTLLEELSFVHEAENILRFGQLFRDDERIICMHIYDELCNDEILCISQIDGFKITDKAELERHNLNPETILDQGLGLFLKQVLEFGFFHADPHPGNILVTPQGKICFLDLGAVGRMLSSDQILLEDFITAFLRKEVHTLIYVIKKMAINIEIQNEKNLRRDILELFDMMASSSLEKIDVKAFFSKFSNVLNKNRIIMPEHIYLLVRGIVLIEGIGRALVPTLNIVEKIKPYVNRIIVKKISYNNLKKEVNQKWFDSYQILNQAPYAVKQILQRFENGDLTIKTENRELQVFQRDYKKNQSVNRYLALGCLFFISACLLISVEHHAFFGIPIISWVFFAIGLGFLALSGLRSLRLD